VGMGLSVADASPQSASRWWHLWEDGPCLVVFL